VKITDCLKGLSSSPLLLGPVKRARFHYLYDTKGQRFLDLDQDQGFGSLGARTLTKTNPLKNLLSTGAWGFYPHKQHGHLQRYLKNLFPGQCFTFLQSAQELRRSLEQLGSSLPLSAGEKINWWFPWRRKDQGFPWTMVAFPVLGRVLVLLVGPQELNSEPWTVLESLGFLESLKLFLHLKEASGDFFETMEKFVVPGEWGYKLKGEPVLTESLVQEFLKAGFNLRPGGELFPPRWFSPGEKKAMIQGLEKIKWNY